MNHFLLFSHPLRRLFSLAALGLPLLLGACSSGGGSSDAADVANAQNEHKIDAADITDKQEADAKFLVKATSNTLLELELAKLAQAKATVPTVRTYGAQLVSSRLELLGALRSLAGSKQLAVPAALGGDEQEAYHEVSTQAGNQLDKHLMALLVKTQKQDEDAFDDMSDDAYDGDIRGFAAKFHEPVEKQLSNAKDIADAVDDLP